MIRLQKLSIRNFMSFESADLELQKTGLYLISGWNKKEGDSNGSGKSSILNAICFCLFGKTSTGLTKNDVRRWVTQKPMTVELTLSEGEEVYKITRTDDETTFTISGKPVEGHKADIQSTINETFKTSYDIFINSTMFSLNRSNPLAASTDAEKKKLFKPIFQLERLDKAYDKAKDKYSRLSTNLDGLNISFSHNESDLKEAKVQELSYQDKYNGFSDERNKAIAELKTKIENLTPKPEEGNLVKELKAKVDTLEEEYKALTPLVDSWRLTLSSMQEEKLVARSKWQEDAELLLGIAELKESVICKHCGSTITRTNMVIHRNELEKEQGLLSDKATNIEKKMVEVDKKIVTFLDLEVRLDSAKRKLDDELHKVAMRQSANEINEQRIKDLEGQIRKLAKSDNPYNDMLVKTRDKISKLELEVEKGKGEIEKTSIDADVYAFLKWVFSKEGVSSFIIERAFGRLESLANRYLSLISTEGFQLEIKPQKELKSKAIKEEIDIVVKTGNQRALYWALSDGQRQRLNIAMLLAVYRLCKDLGINRFDFLLLDEVLDLSLAEKGQSDVMGLMRRLLASEVHNIFVISHRPEISADFDRNIEVVRREDGVSYVK